MYTADDFLVNASGSDEYTITLEYELQREKEKNKILEQRIKNKQIFIAQMKEMQIELDDLTQKCRTQLQEERKKREQLEKVEVRSYLQKISDLEHQLSLLRNRNQNDMEPYRKYFTNQKINPSISNPNKELKNNRSNKNLKKHNNQAEDQRNATRTSFITHFLQMVEVYTPNIKDQTEKKQLKIAWRWIKDVVKEWDQQKNYIQQFEDFFEQVKEYVGLEGDQSIQQVLQALKQDGRPSNSNISQESGEFDGTQRSCSN